MTRLENPGPEGHMKKLVPRFVWIWASVITCSVAQSGPVWINASNGLSGAVPGVGQLVVDRVTGTTLYALTAGGSIFTSSDSGSNWAALSISGVNVIALDPASSTLYAGTQQGVLKTIDGGQTWSHAGLSGVAVSVLTPDPHTPATLYATGSGGIYKTFDGGLDWNAAGVLNQFYGAVQFMAVDPFTSSIVYAMIGGPHATMFKSTDGGQTWSIVTNPGDFYATMLVTDPSVPSKLYANRGGMGLSVSTDAGATWAATGLNDYPIAFAIDPTKSNTLYASTASDTAQTIVKSTDGGQTWALVDTINATRATAIPVIRSLVFGSNASIFVTTGSGVFKSTDAGRTWGGANAGLRLVNIRMLVSDPVNTETIYAGGDQGLFKSTDSGTNWTELATFQVQPPSISTPFPPVPEFAEVHSLVIGRTNPNILYLGTARPGGCYSGDITLHRSTDDGSTWSGLAPFQNAGCLIPDVLAIDPIDPNTLYLPLSSDWEGNAVYKTTDGGAHWTSLGSCPAPFTCYYLVPGYEINSFLIDPNTSATFYAATDVGVFRSTDNGASFLPAGLASIEVALLAIDPHRSNVLYAAASNIYNAPQGFLGLYKSTDSGASWSPINQGLGEILAAHPTVSALLVDPDRTNILYLATYGYGVFRSSDGGATWAAFNDGLPSLDVRSLTIVRRLSIPHRNSRPGTSASNSVYAGTPAGVFKTR